VFQGDLLQIFKVYLQGIYLKVFNNYKFIESIQWLKKEEIIVWDGYQKEEFRFKCNFFGSVANLLIKHKQLEQTLSFSKLFCWCYKCWGNCKNPLHIGSVRTQKDYINTIYDLDQI
jgi:hypothetical protein